MATKHNFVAVTGGICVKCTCPWTTMGMYSDPLVFPCDVNVTKFVGSFFNIFFQLLMQYLN